VRFGRVRAFKQETNMVTPSIGIVELLIVFIVTVFWLAIPVGVLYLLFVIYKKLNKIEEALKKDAEE